MSSSGSSRVVRYVGLIGHEVVVHEPAERHEHLAALGALLSRAADAAGTTPAGT